MTFHTCSKTHRKEGVLDKIHGSFHITLRSSKTEHTCQKMQIIYLPWEICLQVVALLDFALEEIFLVQKENECCFREVFIVQHLLEHILRLDQSVCAVVLIKNLNNRTFKFSKQDFFEVQYYSTVLQYYHSITVLLP